MYKSKLNIYKKILFALFIIYYACLPFICLQTENWPFISFIFDIAVLMFTGFVNFSTIAKQDRYIAENYEDIYDSFRYNRRRPLNISYILYVNGDGDPRMENMFEETNSLIKLIIAVLAALFAGFVLTVLIETAAVIIF